jgi:hypothetical protein
MFLKLVSIFLDKDLSKTLGFHILFYLNEIFYLKENNIFKNEYKRSLNLLLIVNI